MASEHSAPSDDPRLAGIRALVDSPKSRERARRTPCLFYSDCGDWDWVRVRAPASFTVPDLDLWRSLCYEQVPAPPQLPRSSHSEG